MVVLGAGWASRINLFEQMFAPLPGATYVAAAGAPLPGEDVVMAVTQGGASRAYPVRILAYHHVVNDEVGTPVATRRPHFLHPSAPPVQLRHAIHPASTAAAPSSHGASRSVTRATCSSVAPCGRNGRITQ